MSNERLLILNADDYGMCHATNQAISTLLLEGSITSTSLMMTCPWTLEAVSTVKQNPQMDVGIHITHTSEWNNYKWGPVRKGLFTLTDDHGYFPPDTRTVMTNANPVELREEAIAQIELAIQMGIEPTNIDNHMGSMGHVIEMAIELCEEYRLPLRYAKNQRARASFQNPRHDELVALAQKKRISLPDYIEMLPFSVSREEDLTYAFTKEAATRVIENLKPGLTELVFHPSLDAEELKAITNTWQVRRYDFDVFRDDEIVQLLKDKAVRLTSWREVRDIQRS